MKSAGTILGFDFGEKNIGVAVGQAVTATATPLEMIRNNNNKPDWSRIQEIIADWKPDALVLGVPLKMDGSRQAMTDMAEKFSRQLEGRFNLPVYMADERLTSFEARRRLKSTEDLDPVAAQIILEGWLYEQITPVNDTMREDES